jgi:hypothetical protein
VRKSQANVVAACWRRNARHDSRARSGAGGKLASISSLRTVVGETATPRPLSSPTIRRYSPVRILPGETKDQSSHRRLERWPSRPDVRIRPATGNQLAVPTQQRLRPDREAGPGRARQ